MATGGGSNVPTKKDLKQQLVMLKKDQKDICRVRCSLQIEVASSWNITNIVLESTLENLAECSHFRVYPASINDHQNVEWGKFLRYLRDYKKVAIARSEPYCFYILPPDSGAILDSAKVAYMVEEVVDTCGDQKHTLSASGNCMAQPLENVPPKVSSHISNSHRKHATQPQKAVSLNIIQKKVLKPDSECTEKDSALNPNLALVHPSFLENLGRAHDWIFGAIAELNLYAKKAQAEIPVLTFVDDGYGMTHEEMQKLVSLGHKKLDKEDFDRIGRFGTGFKTGAMRLGRDALVITQTANSRSIAFLSQTLNEEKYNLETPIISYQRRGQSMFVDTSIQSKSLAKYNMKAIKEFSPFDEFLIGEKIANFNKSTGTQIYIWNLDRWGSSYTLEWQNIKLDTGPFLGDITTRHRQVRSRPGQTSRKVPLDYSLQAYLEVIFLDPRMKICVQGSKVKAHPLAKFLSKTVNESVKIMGKYLHLTLGRCQLEWDQANCGIFLYWHGRLIEAYKRVGVMLHSADMGRGVIGVIDVSTLMSGENGQDFVHSNKQGFLDCEPYTRLLEWLSSRVNAYCDKHVDPLLVDRDDAQCKPDNEWVQCDKCRKWRMLTSDFDIKKLPLEWFCYMEPYLGSCSTPEQKLQPGVVTVSTKRTGYECNQNSANVSKDNHGRLSDFLEDLLDEIKEDEEDEPQRPLKKLRRGLSRKRTEDV
ncbi:hypothetical protein V2J09_006105 [Rumex salicifolius]